MKKILILSFFLFSAVVTNAQHNHTLREGQAFGNNNSKSFTTTLTGFQVDYVEIEWRDFLLQYGGISGDATINGNGVQIETENVALPVLDNQLVSIMAILQPVANREGLDSVSLTFWIVRESEKYLDPITDEGSGSKIKDWLLLFDKKLDEDSITKN